MLIVLFESLITGAFACAIVALYGFAKAIYALLEEFWVTR